MLLVNISPLMTARSYMRRTDMGSSGSFESPAGGFPDQSAVILVQWALVHTRTRDHESTPASIIRLVNVLQ